MMERSAYKEAEHLFFPVAGKALNILVVEDDRMDRELLERNIKRLGYKTFPASNGAEALGILQNEAIDIVLMDRFMPVMDGMQAVREIKARDEFSFIPVIMITGADSPQEMKEGLDAGVFYYLAKPVNEDVLKSVMSAACREIQQISSLRGGLEQNNCFHLIETCRFKFHTLADVESLAPFMARCFPNPAKVLPGLAALMINALEHGNLGIGYKAKGDLIDTGTWRAEVERRQALEEHKTKFVEVVVSRRDTGIYVVITDQGPGFDWKRYMRIDPARAGDNHGRGIAQANAACFDKIAFNEKGNQVVAFVNNEPQLNW